MKAVTNRILIADDDPTNLLFLKKGVKNLPFEFTFVRDGEEALQEILNTPYDLFLLDVIMPGLTGFEVIEKYLDSKPADKKPFLFLTGNDDQEAILKGFNLGAVDYITKPFSLHEIRKRIEIHHELYKAHKELDLYAKEMQGIAEARAEQLIHADRLATMGTMAAGIMHEINNPATFISGNIQIMQKKFLPLIENILKESGRTEETKVKIMLEELPKMFEGILNGVARIKKITDGLKAFSRSHKTEFRPVTMCACIDNALSFCKGTIPKNVSVVFDENNCSLSRFEGDQQQIEQIIINLVVNSTHALENRENPEITISTEEKPDSLILKIRDNGPGIPKDVLDKIWNPFFTTKAKGKGTGLGLSICKEMIEAHRGQLSYTGVEGKGAEFTIVIPKMQETA